MERQLLTLLAETPVHAGGSESVDVVDLPIQREAATGLPVIWGQSLKGALRQAWRDTAGFGEADGVAVFGSAPPAGAEGESGELSPGAVAVADAHLVALPAATLHTVFAWVTSPLLLSRLVRKARLLGVDASGSLGVTLPGGYGLGGAGWSGRQVVGSFLANVQDDPRAARVGAALAGLVCPDDAAFGFTRAKMAADVLVVDQAVCGGLARTGTDVVARVQLKEEAKTVNNLFYSEYLPAETVLASVLRGPAEHLARLWELLDGKPLQLGGDETIGRGLLWCRMHTAASLRAALPQVPAGETPPSLPTRVTPSAAPSGPPPPGPRPAPSDSRPGPASMPRRHHG